MTPMFSLVHPSARPEEFKRTRDLWVRAASKIADYEYVVCFDWGAAITPQDAAPARLVWNYWTRCSVDATNVAAQCAVGRILVVISDDILPCQNWDQELIGVRELLSPSEPCVVQVSTGGSADDRGLLAVQILNRARYEQVGYLFHPSYVSMYADDEFSEHARRDGVLVQARHIMFRHEHWTSGERPMDEVYARQNAKPRYAYGERLLQYRRAKGFPREMPEALMKARLQVA